VDLPTNPVIDPVGRSNHGGQSASWLSHCRQARSPFKLRAASDEPITDYRSN
jgi:hypothetical protein